MPFEAQELAKFSQAGRAISDAMQRSFEVFAMGEAQIICRQWVAHIPETTEPRALLRSRSRSTIKAMVNNLKAYSTTVNTGRKGGAIGRVWFKTKWGKFQEAGFVTDDGNFQQKHWHFADDDWARISTGAGMHANFLPGMIAAGKAAIGLARQSVVQIADSLGLKLDGDGVERAREARPSNGEFYVNGYGVKESQGDQFSVELVNQYPRIVESKIDIAAEEVLSNRMAFVAINLEFALKKDLAKIAKAFPYMQVT